MENQLRQLQNVVTIIGTVKDVNLEVKMSKNGKEFIKGYVEITVKRDNQVNSVKVNTFCMATWKTYAGLRKVKDEYKVGDRVKVARGTIDFQEYCGKNGYKYFNVINSNAFTRDFEDDGTDKAIMNVECVVTKLEDEEKDGLLTGNVVMECFTVDYFGKVIDIKNVVAKGKIAQTIGQYYYEGCTGLLGFNINNYVVTEQKKVESEGFGDFEEIETTSGRFVNNYEITGGKLPNSIDTAYTKEEIEEARRQRNLEMATVKGAEEDVKDFNGFGDDNSSSPFGGDEDLPF